MDIISLYPYVDKNSENPIRHPKVITSNIDFDMTKYFGMAKVKFIPPRGMYHPVLPCRSNRNLKFPLCRTCAENESKVESSCSIEVQL